MRFRFPAIMAWTLCVFPAGNAAGEETFPSPGILKQEVTVTYRQPQKIVFVRRSDGGADVSPDRTQDRTPGLASVTVEDSEADMADASNAKKRERQTVAEPPPTNTLEAKTPPQKTTETTRTRRPAREALAADEPHQPVSHMLDEMNVYELSPAAHLLAEPHRSPVPAQKGESREFGQKNSPQALQASPAENPSERAPHPRMASMLASGREYPEEWKEIIHEAADLFDLDTRLIAAVIRAESAFNPYAVSPAGAEGAMQLMPATQVDMGLIDPFDPRANIYAGSAYLRQQMERFGDVRLALAAYNAGPANVEKYGGVPPFSETQSFVSRVMAGWRP